MHCREGKLLALDPAVEMSGVAELGVGDGPFDVQRIDSRDVEIEVKINGFQNTGGGEVGGVEVRTK